MKQKIFLVSSVLFVILGILGIVVPKAFISDIEDISQMEKQCANEFLSQHLDNPIQRALILKTAVERREGDVFFMGVYTFFGIRCEKVMVICESRAKTIYSNEACYKPIGFIATLFFYLFE